MEGNNHLRNPHPGGSAISSRTRRSLHPGGSAISSRSSTTTTTYDPNSAPAGSGSASAAGSKPRPTATKKIAIVPKSLYTDSSYLINHREAIGKKINEHLLRLMFKPWHEKLTELNNNNVEASEIVNTLTKEHRGQIDKEDLQLVAIELGNFKLLDEVTTSVQDSEHSNPLRLRPIHLAAYLGNTEAFTTLKKDTVDNPLQLGDSSSATKQNPGEPPLNPTDDLFSNPPDTSTFIPFAFGVVNGELPDADALDEQAADPALKELASQQQDHDSFVDLGENCLATPFSIAVARDHTEFMEALLDYGIRLHNGDIKSSPLYLLAEAPCFDLLEKVLEQLQEVDVKDCTAALDQPISNQVYFHRHLALSGNERAMSNYREIFKPSKLSFTDLLIEDLHLVPSEEIPQLVDAAWAADKVHKTAYQLLYKNEALNDEQFIELIKCLKNQLYKSEFYLSLKDRFPKNPAKILELAKQLYNIDDHQVFKDLFIVEKNLESHETMGVLNDIKSTTAFSFPAFQGLNITQVGVVSRDLVIGLTRGGSLYRGFSDSPHINNRQLVASSSSLLVRGTIKGFAWVGEYPDHMVLAFNSSTKVFYQNFRRTASLPVLAFQTDSPITYINVFRDKVNGDVVAASSGHTITKHNIKYGTEEVDSYEVPTGKTAISSFRLGQYQTRHVFSQVDAWS